jgi:outer membrane lipoprotein-sorting protein
MAGQGRAAVIGATFACLTALLVSQPAWSQTGSQVPLPHAKPRAATPAVTGTVPQIVPPPADARAQAGPPPVATNPFAALLGKSSQPDTLDPKQRAIIDRVSNYLMSVQVLTGKFVQVGPDGGRSQGELYMQKPGKIRFEYDPPSPIDIVADGESVVVRDRNLATQDVYPLSQTPLRFLLADHLDLLKDTHLVAVYADDTFVTIVVEEKNGIIGTSRMMIMFSAKDMQLKQWTITDPQGFDTTVAVYNLDSTKRPDPSMFRIDYTRYRN